jgi:DNA-binding IclR family transcriptional regulator
MKSENIEDKYNVPALDKALDVLEYLSTSSIPLPLSTIAKDLNNTSSEVFRVVNCLVKRNYLVKDETVNAYSLSLKFFELTNNTPPLKRLIDASVLPLVELVKAIGCSCHLSVLEDGDIVVLYEQEGIDVIHVHIKAGYRMPATLGSSGKVLLAQLEEHERETVLHRNSHFSGLSPEKQESLRREIRGYSGLDCLITPSDLHSEILDVVSYLPLYRFRFAALAVPLFKSSADPRQIAIIKQKLLSANEKIRKAIGS